jgi:hypothetical protein
VLGAYISDKVAKWQITFTEDFYEQIFRLWKQTYNKQKQKRPAFEVLPCCYRHSLAA